MPRRTFAAEHQQVISPGGLFACRRGPLAGTPALVSAVAGLIDIAGTAFQKPDRFLERGFAFFPHDFKMQNCFPRDRTRGFRTRNARPRAGIAFAPAAAGGRAIRDMTPQIPCRSLCDLNASARTLAGMNASRRRSAPIVGQPNGGFTAAFAAASNCGRPTSSVRRHRLVCANLSPVDFLLGRIVAGGVRFWRRGGRP